MPQQESPTVFQVCLQCGQSKKQFYRTNSGLYSQNGYLPICRNCLQHMFEYYKDSYHDIFKAMKRICMAFDLYYNEEIFKKCMIGESPNIGNYFRQLNIKQHKDKTFDTTLREGFNFYSTTEPKEWSPTLDKGTPERSNTSKSKISPQNKNKWGDIGDCAEDYELLNEHYKYLTDANPNSDSNQEIFIRDLCHIHRLKTKALQNGANDDYNKLSELYRKTFQQANLKAGRDTLASDEFLVGVGIETIEKYTPAEYYKNKNLYKDFEGIGDYFTRFCLRPLRNIEYGTTDRDHEYYVREEKDDGTYEDDEYDDEE